MKMLMVSTAPILPMQLPERGMTHSNAQSKAQVKGHSQIIKMRRKKRGN